jgi:hypothetical protein
MAQSAPDSRWITVRETYDHYWSKTAVTHFPPGEYRVKNAVGRRSDRQGQGDRGEGGRLRGCAASAQEAEARAQRQDSRQEGE